MKRFVAAGLLMFAPVAAHAHGGGLDNLGCHHNRRAGGYHCHRGALAGRSFASKAEAVLALGDKLPPLRPGSTVPPVATPPITGKSRIIDGDTIEIARQRMGMLLS